MKYQNTDKRSLENIKQDKCPGIYLQLHHTWDMGNEKQREDGKILLAVGKWQRHCAERKELRGLFMRPGQDRSESKETFKVLK